MLFLLNFGIVPFKAKDMQILYNKIIIGSYKFPDLMGTSIELIDLIKRMLVTDLNDRISLKEIFEHPWIK